MLSFDGVIWRRKTLQHFQDNFVAPIKIVEIVKTSSSQHVPCPIVMIILSHFFASVNSEPERHAKNPHLSPWSRPALMILLAPVRRDFS
jgi:hypothetical protein